MNKAKNTHFDAENFIVEFTDGRTLSVLLVYFPRLLQATEQQRKNYTMSGGGVALHWDELDEDISVENLLFGIGDTTVHAQQKTY